MSNKRRRILVGGVTERAISLFRYGLQLQREGKENTDLFKKVDRALWAELRQIKNLKPWYPSVFWVTCGSDEEEHEILASVRPDCREYWNHVIAIRRELVAAPVMQ
jgi:hypothetical protein